MSVSAMKQALDLLETSWGCGDQDTLKYWNETAQVLRQAIEFEEMVKKGTKAWAGTPDNWVDDLRGGVEKQDPDDDIYDIWVEQKIKEKNVPQP